LLFLLFSFSEISTAADNEFAKVASRVDWRLGSGVILQLHQLDSVINLGIGETGRPGNCRWSLCGPTGTAPGMAVRPRDHTGRWHSPDDFVARESRTAPCGHDPTLWVPGAVGDSLSCVSQQGPGIGDGQLRCGDENPFPSAAWEPAGNCRRHVRTRMERCVLMARYVEQPEQPPLSNRQPTGELAKAFPASELNAANVLRHQTRHV
jgi:hypothetical protein